MTFNFALGELDPLAEIALLCCSLNIHCFPSLVIVMAVYAPLREQIFQSSRGSPIASHSADRPLTYMTWSHESMKAVLKAVIEDGMSVRNAAEHYGVPKRTLGD